MNDIDYYFGAYLEITCNKISVERVFRDCTNSHGPFKNHGMYCHECGLETYWYTGSVEIYPTWLTEILSDDFEDVLLVATPRDIFYTGVIITIGNSTNNFWLSESKSGIISIPTEGEIVDKINAFNSEYVEIVQALNDSPIVQAVVTKFGIIKKEW